MTNQKHKNSQRRKTKLQSVLQDANLRPKTAWTRWVLFVLLLGSFCLFQWNGGIVEFANSMAKNGIDAKNMDAAQWWINIARTVSTSSGYTDFLQARTDRLNGRLDKMANHLKSAFEKNFDPAKLDREQTLALATIGRLDDEVENKLNRWLKEPDAIHSDIIDAYANGLTAVSRFEHAAELLQAWETSAPWEPTPHYRMARLNEHLLQFQLAEDQYRMAIKKSPKFDKATYNLARLLLDQRRPDEAIKLYQAITSKNGMIAAKIGIASCYKTLGETDRAKSLLEEVLKVPYDQHLQSYQSFDYAPERNIAASELGGIEAELGDYSAAKEHLELALKSFPLDSIGRYSYAVALRGLGLKEEADRNFQIVRNARESLDEVSTLQEVLRQNPKATDARLKIGKIVLEHESERTGVFWIQSVFAYDPENQEAHKVLAEYYESKKTSEVDDQKIAAYHRSFIKKTTNK
ncbi:MAG: tetratricopeptide repeat protein [Pirellula sp.]